MIRDNSGELFAQLIALICGHWFINTYGNLNKKSYKPKELVGCMLCYKTGKK
jgi:hypothetical protein